METAFSLTEPLKNDLLDFFETHDIHLFGENLRRQFIHYLEYELRTGVPLYFNAFLYPFNELLDLLDKIAGEKQQHAIGERINEQPILKQETTTEKVIAFLKASLSPERIFLLHKGGIPNQVGNDGRIRGDGTMHFDLLVVIPDGVQTGFTYYEQVISMANFEQASINVSLHKAATLYKQLEEGHIYYSIVCTKENLVYDDGLTALPAADKTLVKAAYEKADAVFYNSYKKATGFLEGTNDYYGKHDKSMAAFMLHQAIEITLRGIITALLGSCAKTHCFKELKKPLKRCAPELPYLISAHEAEEARLLHLLEKAYLESRYADDFTISDNDIDLLMEAAKVLHEKVKMIFEEKMKKLVSNYLVTKV
jgi:HEPN domain-containing protein